MRPIPNAKQVPLSTRAIRSNRPMRLDGELHAVETPSNVAGPDRREYCRRLGFTFSRSWTPFFDSPDSRPALSLD